MMSRAVGLSTLVFMLTTLSALGGAGRQPADPTASLAAATRSFLDLWFAGDVNAAVDRYLSPLTIERPALLAPLDELGGERRARPDARADARTRLREGLLAARRELSPSDTKRPPVAAMSGLRAEELIQVLGERGVATRRLTAPPALAFPVTGVRDLSWTGTVGPSVRSVLSSDVLPRESVYAVVVLLAAPLEDKSLPVVFVWSTRGSTSAPNWKLVTILPVLTN